MRHSTTRGQTAFLLALALLLLPAAALPGTAPAAAAGATGFDLCWWTVDGGGHTWSTGGGYQLGGTIGQPDAGLLAGSGYTLGGGFWRGGETAATPYNIYLPLVMR